MIAVLRQMVCAFQFLTALPIPGDCVREERDLSRSMAFYPLVGLLIGGACLLVYGGASYFFAPAASLAAAFVAGILITGGLHLDGFADLCDGFYAGKTKEEILSIMKDSHIGAMAVLGIFCLLLLKLALFYSLQEKGRLVSAFLLAPVVGRWVMTVAASLYPYARSGEGTAKPFVENAGRTEAAVSTVLMAGFAYAAAGGFGIVTAAAVLAAALVFMRWVSKKIGGITGDVLGSLNELSEVAALIILGIKGGAA